MIVKGVRIAVVMVIATTLSACAVFHHGNDSSQAVDIKHVQDKLSQSFHNLTVDSVTASEVPGLFEVTVGSRVIYYAPAQDLLLFGEMYRTDGHSVTQDKMAALQSSKAKTIDTSAAVTVGSGPIDVLAFVDPDCGYCRKAHDFFSSHPELQSRITQHVFFLPLAGRADAEARAENFICAPPALRQAAYDELWTHAALDGQTYLRCDGAAEKLAQEAREAARFGVQGTPTFVVKGQVISGFAPDRLIALLTN